MRPERYIGITGFSTREEVSTVFNHINIYHRDRLFMAGVLVSDRTLRGIPSRRYPERYPKIKTLQDIFYKHPNLLNLVHFNTHEPEKLCDDLLFAQKLAGPNCHGFQLNIAWPDPSAVRRYREAAPDGQRTIVLQCGPQVLAEVERSPRRLASQLKRYEGLIDYVLIDPSGGKGVQFSVQEVVGFFSHIRTEMPDIGLVVGGGLRSDNLPEQLGGLQSLFNDFGIDAESGVRDPATDKLDISACRQYAKKADELFAQITAV